MTRLDAIPGPPPYRPAAAAPMARETGDAPASPAPPSRAVVAAAARPAARAAPPPTGATSAGFLAHLIATAQSAPQTCRLRRASPNEAAESYRATAALIAAGRR